MIEILLTLALVLTMGVLMSAIDNLAQAVNDLNTSATNAVAKINELKNQPNNDAAIQTATDSINAIKSQLDSAI